MNISRKVVLTAISLAFVVVAVSAFPAAKQVFENASSAQEVVEVELQPSADRLVARELQAIRDQPLETECYQPEVIVTLDGYEVSRDIIAGGQHDRPVLPLCPELSELRVSEDLRVFQIPISSPGYSIQQTAVAMSELTPESCASLEQLFDDFLSAASSITQQSATIVLTPACGG